MNLTAMMIGFQPDLRDEIIARVHDTEVRIIGEITDYGRATDMVSKEKPNFILANAIDERKLLMFCQQVYILYPKCILVMLAEEVNEAMCKNAMAAGVRLVLSPLPSGEDMVATLKELYIGENSRNTNLAGDGFDVIKSKVLTVFGAKGGVGRTTAAVNLAVRLASNKKSVVLLDFNLQFGDVGLFLGIEPRDTVAELLEEQRTPTLDVIKNYLEYHSSGLQVLFGPKSPEYAEGISGKSVEKIVNILRSYYDYIIIDTSIGFSEINLSLLDLSDQIFFIVSPDISTLKNSKKALILLSSLNMDNKLCLFVNRENSGTISAAEIERILGFPIVAGLPNDYKNAISALNLGRPLVTYSAKSQLAQEYTRITSMIEKNFFDKDPKDRAAELNGKRKRRRKR